MRATTVPASAIDQYIAYVQGDTGREGFIGYAVIHRKITDMTAEMQGATKRHPRMTDRWGKALEAARANAPMEGN